MTSGSKSTTFTALVAPRSVALIGASGNDAKLTSRPMRFLKQHGFQGKIFPINPGQSEIAGHTCLADISLIPEVPDHAYVLLDSDPALAAVEACGQAGIRCVSVLADGFAEAGAQGLERQAKLTSIARRHDMLLIGPNSTGVVNTRNGFACTTNAAFAAERLPQGRFAVLSQSGSVIGAILSRAAAVGLGFGTYVSLGNEALNDVGTLGRIMIDDPETDGIVLFLETLRNRAAFVDFAHAAHAAGKPVLAYLVGRSKAGGALAASHTGAMTGGSHALEAFLKAHGVIMVDGFEALAELSNALPLRRRLAGRPRQVTVVTTTGGGGGMVYDRIGLKDIPLAPMSAAAHSAIAANGTVLKQGSLVDVTLAGTKYDVMKAVMTGLMNDPDCGLIVAAIGSSAQFNPELAVKPIVDAVAEAGDNTAPVLAVPIPNAPESLAMFNAGSVPACRTIEGAAEVVAALMGTQSYQPAEDARLPEAVEVHLAAQPQGAMTETEAAALFGVLDVMTPASLTVTGVEDLPETLKFDGPYAVKVVSPDILHKSDIGGVAIGVEGRAGLVDALSRIAGAVADNAPSATIAGYLIQKMEKGLAEAIVGLSRDPIAGAMITVGAGGVMTEIYQDVTSRPAPVSMETAREMLTEVKSFALLRGFRGAAPGDLEALAVTVMQVSRLAMNNRVAEAEINPVLVRGQGEGVIALDALVTLTEDATTP